MGSKLTVLAAVQLSLVGIVAAQPAGDLQKQGIDAYKAGDYTKAATLLERAYKADPKPETLFALAQAERLGGKCAKAIPHYKKLLEKTTDLSQAKLIQNNLGLCETVEKPAEEPPKPVTKTVVREVNKSDRLATAMLGGGMLAIGGSVGLFLAASGATSDAKAARTLDDHDRFLDRATRDRVLAFVAGGVGAGLVVGAIVKWKVGGEKTTAVAIVPASDGATFAVSGRW